MLKKITWSKKYAINKSATAPPVYLYNKKRAREGNQSAKVRHIRALVNNWRNQKERTEEKAPAFSTKYNKNSKITPRRHNTQPKQKEININPAKQRAAKEDSESNALKTQTNKPPNGKEKIQNKNTKQRIRQEGQVADSSRELFACASFALGECIQQRIERKRHFSYPHCVRSRR